MIRTLLSALEHWLHGGLVILRGRLRGNRLQVAAGQGEQALARAQMLGLRARRHLRRDFHEAKTQIRIRVRGGQLRRIHVRQ